MALTAALKLRLEIENTLNEDAFTEIDYGNLKTGATEVDKN
tara:strand:+ start:2007 stop:2129 length:123 start_codon:yes stop_codon:yes gene_type:complete